MVLDGRLCIAVITVDPCFGILIFRRHWLTLDGTLDLAELRLHVGHAFTANRTTV